MWHPCPVALALLWSGEANSGQFYSKHALHTAAPQKKKKQGHLQAASCL